MALSGGFTGLAAAGNKMFRFHLSQSADGVCVLVTDQFNSIKFSSVTVKIISRLPACPQGVRTLKTVQKHPPDRRKPRPAGPGPTSEPAAVYTGE